jgi:signal transduction histidine kinase
MPLRDLVADAYQDAYSRLRDRIRSERAKSSCELQMRRADGNAVWVRVVSRPAGDASSDDEEMGVTLSDITALKKAEEELRDLNDTLELRVEERTAEAALRTEQLRALAHELGRTEMRERRQLAELIHDSLKQEVAGARMLLGSVAPTVDDADTRAILEQVDQVLQKAIRTCRTLNDELCPPVLRGAGLVPALQWLATRFGSQQGLEVRVRATTDLEPARDEVSAALFRSVRELLYNVVKYAQVDAAVVEVSSPEDGILELAIDDRGRGFDPAVLDEPTTSGFGLFAVRERLEMLGGSIRVESVPGDGTRVTLRCPIVETRRE